MHTHIHTYHTHKHTHIYTYAHIHTHTCTYTHIHWPAISERIQYRIHAMDSICVLGCATSYRRNLCCPVSVLAARRVLRSAARDEFLVPRASLAIMQRRPVSVVGPSAWNELPFELRSLLMAHPSKFYISLKSVFFVCG